MTLTTIAILIGGLIMVIWGSDLLVDGASDIARRSGLSEFLIGMTIVGIGTSTPEMVVSLISALRGHTDMSIGNIVGSNIFNTNLILGVTALILPLAITRNNLRRDIPINIFATLMLIFLGMKSSIFGIGSNTLTRIDGAIMLVCFALYLYYSFKWGKADGQHEVEESEIAQQKSHRSVIVPILMVAGGLVCLIAGGELFINGATALAKHFGWSDKFIGITILAGGTSLPELATCVVAAFKKKGQLALGNIIGSNIANILLILGSSAIIRPLQMANITGIDLGFLMLSALFLLAAAYTVSKNKLDRVEAVGLLAMEAVYMYLLIKAL